MGSAFSQLINSLPSWLQVGTAIAVLAFVVLVPAFAVLVTATSYWRAHLGLSRLVFSFGALILLFANCYFFSVVLDDRGPGPCPAGVSEVACPENNDVPMSGVTRSGSGCPAWKVAESLGGGLPSHTSIVFTTA